MNWLYNNNQINSIDDFPEGTFGFVYEVSHEKTGKKYIGKKQIFSLRTAPPLKGHRKKRKIIKESDWKNYYGSQKDIKNLVKENKEDEFKREILEICYTKKQLTYYELKWQILKNVLEDDNYLNDNLLGKFYKRDL
jgi:serine/threonine protein kinase